MATKPTVLPRPWATNDFYTTGPFVGLPGKVDPGIGIAAEGHRPGAANPTAAEHENYQQNLVTASWVPWVNSGSSLGAASASIVELNASGKFAVTGYTVLGLVDQTAINISGPNTLAPLVSATSTGGGTIFHTNQTGSSTSYNVVMAGAAVGEGFNCTASPSSSGTCVAVTIPAGSTSRGMAITNAGSGESMRVDSTLDGGPGVVMTSQKGPCLTLNGQGPNATPLVLVPRNFSTTTPGSIWIDNTTFKSLQFYDHLGELRTSWASKGGMVAASGFTAGPTTFSVAQSNVVSAGFNAIAGERYLITMGVDVGRGNGTSPDIIVTATVNGAAFVYSGFIIKTFEPTGVANQTERGWTKSAIYTSPITGYMFATLGLTPTPASNATYAQAFVTVMGSYM